MSAGDDSIAANLARVHEQIAAACARAGRSVESVKLIAVSKTKPLSMLEEALAAGQKSFGENYVQEAVDKIGSLPSADWHFIGSLQTNKAKQVVGKVALIHSVDREKLATELARAAQNAGCVQDILLQVYLGDEATKHGAGLEEAPKLIEHILGLKSLRLCGVMSLPPLSDDEKVARAYFASLRESFEKWRSRWLDSATHFNELSIGTSSDFELAILEGATQVRVGTAIFGAREPARP